MGSLSLLWNGSSDEAPEDGPGTSMALAFLLCLEDSFLENFVRGDVCVEGGGEYVWKPDRDVSGFFGPWEADVG